MGAKQLKELNRLQKENERLIRAVSDLTPDKLILTEAAKGNFYVPLVAAPALIVFVLRDAGWHVNDKRVERLWRREGLSDLFILRGVPLYIWSELPIEGAIGSSPMGDGSEFAAQAVQNWIEAVGAKTTYIEPGSPWENGYCEKFNARFRDEFLNGEIFYTLGEAQILIQEWRKHYNTKRPHSALGYRPPAPETIVQMDQRPIMH